MKIFEININNKSYTFINCIKLNKKDYIAYRDEEYNVYISEIKFNNNEFVINNIDNETYDLVKGAMEL